MYVLLCMHTRCTDLLHHIYDTYMHDGQAFKDLNVFPVTELVHYGIGAKTAPSISGTGVHLAPDDYHAKMQVLATNLRTLYIFSKWYMLQITKQLAYASSLACHHSYGLS
jgi:hypothetical protein